MKSGYKHIPSISPFHNEIHRLAFMGAETLYITTEKPTVSNTKRGELKIYRDGSNFYLYTKLSATQMGKMQWTVE